MSVSDGQRVNAAVTNAAFMSRLVDTSTVGTVDILNTENSTDPTDGALHTTGGAGIEQDLNVGGAADIANDITGGGNLDISGNITNSGDVNMGNDLTVGGNAAITGDLTVDGDVTANNISGTNTGDMTMGSFGVTPNSSGGTIAAQVLVLQPADGSNPGGVSTTTQTFGGAKTFAAQTTFSSATVHAGAIVMQEISTPSTPSSNRNSLFFDTADGLLKYVDDTGTVTTVGSGGGGGGDVYTESTIADNQTSVDDVDDFIVDFNDNYAFTADYSIYRRHTSGGFDYAPFNTNIGTGPNAAESWIAASPDGSVYFVGQFTTWNGLARNRIVKLAADGREDVNFAANVDAGFGSNPLVVTVQANGQVLVGGSFTSFNGNTRNRLVRLNADGTEDTSFYTNLGTGFDSDVNIIVVQSDGDILVGGAFTALNGTTRNNLVRLNSDGTHDGTFYTNLGTAFNSTVRAIAVQADGDILVGGLFTSFNSNTRNRLVRLNSDGTEDGGFYTNLGTAFNITINVIAVQADGDILVGGIFTTLNGNTRNRLVRLNSDGTEDGTFYTNFGGAGGSVAAIVVQPNQQIIIGGAFTTINGNTRNRIYRINADGTEDATFYTNTSSGVTATVSSIALLDNNTFVHTGETVNKCMYVETDLRYSGTLRGVYRQDYLRWDIGADEGFGDDVGITFSMTSAGQLQYTSTNLDGTLVTSVIRFLIRGL